MEAIDLAHFAPRIGWLVMEMWKGEIKLEEAQKRIAELEGQQPRDEVADLVAVDGQGGNHA